jgi:hypothetical protein
MKKNTTMGQKRSNEFDMTMAEFKGSVLAQLQNIQGDITTLNSTFVCYSEKTDKRIGVIEVWKTDIMAKVAILLSIFTIGINLIWDTVKEKFFKG